MISTFVMQTTIKTKKMQNEMTKQEVLDIENPTMRQWTLQQLLVNMTKTELHNVKRVTNTLMAVAYKTQAREQKMVEFHTLIAEAIEIVEKEAADDETNATNKMDNESTIRRRGNRRINP